MDERNLIFPTVAGSLTIGCVILMQVPRIDGPSLKLMIVEEITETDGNRLKIKATDTAIYGDPAEFTLHRSRSVLVTNIPGM